MALKGTDSRKRKRSEAATDEIEIDVSAPEPPSKKALRKAKKDKPVKSLKSETKSRKSKDEVDSEGDEEEKAQNTESSRRSDYGIWIGNLPWTATKADLRTFLTKQETISKDHITRIHMPAPVKGTAPKQVSSPQNKGFAYVDFANQEALKAALALSESLLSGRAVLIKNAKSFEGRPETRTGVPASSIIDPADPHGKSVETKAASLAPNRKPPSRRIWIGNLSFDTTKDDVAEFFKPCGTVVNVFLATFEDSGKCKGYGWVVFDGVEAAGDAVRGWTHVHHGNDEEEKEDDMTDDGERDGVVDGDGNGIAVKTKKAKRSKPKKWFVNRLKGRMLRAEFAEDASTRYHKKYHGTKSPSNKEETTAESKTVEIPEATTEKRMDEKSRKSTSGREGGIKATKEKKPHVKTRQARLGSKPHGAERLTGSIVESKGRKTTFA